MISVVIATKGLEGLPAKIRKFRTGILARIERMLDLIGKEVESRSTEDYLSGPRPQKLGRISGDLARSINHRITGNRVTIGSNLVYARAHEFGAVIVPKRARALVFKVGDRWVRTMRVVLPQRAFLRPALADSRGAMRTIIQRLSNEALREAMG